MIPFVVIIGLILLGAALVYPRTLSHDADVWHVDPLTAPKPSTPNSYRVGPAGTEAADAEGPTFRQDAGVVGGAFSRIAADEGAEVIGGSVEEGWVTYVQQSTLFAFPDYISVRFSDLDDGGSTIAVFSRSRLGQSDLGVNEKRVNDWLAKINAVLS